MQSPSSRRQFLRRGGAAALGLSPLLSSLRALGAESSTKLKTDTPPDALITELRQLIPEVMKKTGVPGLSIAVVRDIRLLWSEGFGVKSTATGEPVTAETVFEAASLSKPAFAYVALKLCETGKLSLDTPLTDTLPEPLIPNEPRLRRVTARLVLSHSSGLPHGRPRGTPITLRFDPGKQFYYSATGFYYLQLVVERLTGRSLGELMKEDFLKPFGMDRSSFGWLDRYEKEAAQGHDRRGNPGLSGNGRYLKMSAEEKASFRADYPEARYPSAAAGLYTTAPDYARFVIEMIRPSGADRFRLSERWTEEMLRPQIKAGDAIDWGLGWGIEHTEAGDAFWHWGDWGVFRNFVVGFRKQRIGAVVLTNSFNGPKAYRELVPKAIGGEHPAFAWVEQYRG